ncbi:hypothetical protein BH10BDE1_BH10BDE1_27710 [soil metagenome]
MRAAFCLILILTTSQAFAAAANSCKTIDLRNRFPPIRNQGHRSGWCYAFSAVDLVAEAQGVAKKTPLSAFDVATTYIAGSPDEFYAAAKKTIHSPNAVSPSDNPSMFGLRPSERKGGTTAFAAALYLRQNRMCAESHLKSQDGNNESVDLTHEQIGLASQYEIFEGHTFIGQQIRQMSGDIERNERTCTTETIDVALQTAVGNLATEKLKEATNLACRGSRPFSRPMQVQLVSNTAGVIEGQTGPFAKSVDELLSRGRPIGIGYNYCGLQVPAVEECGHESIIVGRQFNEKTKACELLVRNSHGPYCKQYEGLNVRCDTKTPGYFWVDENILAKLAFDFTWIETDLKKFGKPETGAAPKL